MFKEVISVIGDMQELERVRRLIAQASMRAGSQYAMAKTIGYPDAAVANWKSGKPCPATAQALMAEVAGLNAQEVGIYALIAAEKNDARREKLFTVLGKHCPSVTAMTRGLACILGSAVWVFEALRKGWPLYTMYRNVK